ncbi:short chain dehydrogenase reductase family protein [Stagonosporopsis vannaccii]|nr:short chain dehydrogenase reductase family protein [Stagonosporopsis vannaccii]
MTTYEGPYRGNDMFKSFTQTWHSSPYPSISPSRPELSAAGKVIFITGGGSGIGKATALAFAQAGAKAIAIFGRRVANLESAAVEISAANPSGTTAVIVEGVDITQRSSLNAAFKRASTKAGGKVDVLVSNAGTLKPPTPLLTYGEPELRESIEANLVGSFNVVQTVAPLLAPNAKILNISSGIAHIAPWKGFWAYAALKAAVVRMFDFLQVENPGLGVFNVQPGVVTTELNEISGNQGQDDVALPGQFNVWLASPEAEFLRGRFVWVNWDVEELKTLAGEIKESALLKIDLNGVSM